MIGNCSLSAALTDSEEDLLDLFCRVENMPKEIIKDWLQGKITWRTVTEYYDHLEKLPIGPNIATLLGHSNLRAHVMGLSRSLNEDATKKDIDEMKEILKQALEIGYFGLSIDLLPFHKMTGTRFEGIPIPSQRASFGEYMQLASVIYIYIYTKIISKLFFKLNVSSSFRLFESLELYYKQHQMLFTYIQ